MITEEEAEEKLQQLKKHMKASDQKGYYPCGDCEHFQIKKKDGMEWGYCPKMDELNNCPKKDER